MTEDAPTNEPGQRRPMMVSRPSASDQSSFMAPCWIRYTSRAASPCPISCIAAGYERSVPNSPIRPDVVPDTGTQQLIGVSLGEGVLGVEPRGTAADSEYGPGSTSNTRLFSSMQFQVRCANILRQANEK